MDRLFLTALVDELAPAVAGARIRSVAVDREQRFLALGTSLARPRALVFSWNRDAPGLFRGEAPEGGVSTPELRKWLNGARIERLEISDVDRRVTLALSRARLSGKKEGVSLVLEVTATRSALYLVGPEGTVIETFASSAPRLGAGERFEPQPPPPGAAPLAADAAEFAERGGGASLSKSSLLAASGATPLVVGEMRWLVNERGLSPEAAFAEVRRKLAEPGPLLYLSRDRGERSPVASPIHLESETELEPHSMASFSEAMAEAFYRELRSRSRRKTRQRVRTAIARALEKNERLARKLASKLDALEPPEVLRGRGERLLAALGQARVVRNGFVAIPDLFDSEAKEIEIPVDPRRNLVQNTERLFASARRSARARRAIEERLAELASERAYWESLELALEDAGDEAELEELAREISPEERPASERPRDEARSSGPRRFETESGRRILVGRSGRSNDVVTFRIAGPDDLWFHAAGIPGAHVILTLEPGAAPEDADVETAASVAAHFSKARGSGAVEVMVTERKNVSKIKGAPPGTVRVKTHRTVRVPPRLPESTTREG